MIEVPEISHRFLSLNGYGSGRDDAPVVVLIVVCILFCLIWTPLIFRCRGPCLEWLHGRNRFDNDDAQAEIIRNSLENLRRLAMNNPSINIGRQGGHSNLLERLSPQDRKEYLNNVLMSRRIMKVLREGVPTGEDGQKATLLLADVMDTESTTSVTSVEPCSICLNDYVEGDVLCWSQNSKCQHCFHKDCAVEWLMTHEECPLCRNNYLSLDGDEDELLNDEDGSPLSILTIPSIMQRMNDTAPEDTMTLLRGMHLIYLLSQLQAMADDDETDAAAHLQGIELARIPDHQRRIQQEPTTVNDLEEGRNIRIENPTLSGQQVNYHEISTAILRVPSIMNATGTSTISTSEVGNGISEEPVELRWERGDTEAEVPPSIPPIPLASETRDSLVSSMIDVDEIGK